MRNEKCPQSDQINGGTTSYAELKVKGQRFFCLVTFSTGFSLLSSLYGLKGLRGDALRAEI